MKSNEKNKIFDIIVIGGGASGMMAASVAASNGKSVLVLEKNTELGAKLQITGGGRCNITNAEYDTRALLAHYGSAEKYLHSAFAVFGSKDTFIYFKNLGIDIVVEAGKRAFPSTHKATDVCTAMVKDLKCRGVSVELSSPVTHVSVKDEKIEYVETKSGKKYFAKSYVLATGGSSHPETGSTGDGFSWLENIGHTVVSPTPSIVPLKVKERWIKLLSGKTLPAVKVTYFVDGVKNFSVKGNVLCTHFGLSGPTILNSAKKVADLLHTGIVTGSIDIFPSLDQGSLEKRIIEVFDANKNKMLKNIFAEFVPAGTAQAILESQSFLDGEKKVHSVTKEERKALAKSLKSLTFTVQGLMGLDRAVVVDGGVSLDEIDFKTMRSKKISNLFVTGDLLHINRPSGGYSLQLCWTTGYIAGKNA